ncbi:3-oxoacyl-[acyl-carrier-protein] reductase [Tengunoibacter tsumagoiensis]|uniref:3-oxoacyl-[acyl-carrier-protein] reductase n=1 Tax=Tengunoibacter tsumagoiensis TaxID=2014871 RepID=A0A402A4L0_9CHLR|nr:3-oxoacyl-[acyl-carrier-protein] reductase [Tengunoibacter tsumagoiensis]GCE13996.1 beta-ketoacyl-ACP reductase [Tengunoibacter tsumagoiensis]
MSETNVVLADLAGQVALVTGGSRGIGRAIALELGRRGADVCVNYLGNEARAKETVAEIEAFGVKALAIAADVSKSEDVERLFREVTSTLGSVSVLVNNAGITRDNLLVRLSEDDWDSVLDTNLKSSYLCCKAAARSMIRARKGCIVNIASVVALGGNPGQANYTAAKGGLIALTKTLAIELGGRNIRVNAVAPGFIETDMTANLTKEAHQALAGRIVLGHLGAPEDVAAAVGFLCSPPARYITGQVLSIDGGLSLT